MEPLEPQMQMLLLESLLRVLVEVEADQAHPAMEAMVPLEAFRPAAAEVAEPLKQARSLAAEVPARTAWQSLQLTSKHEIRSNQFRNQHRRERHHLGWRFSLDSSRWNQLGKCH
jgi:hypothetical protein